MGISIEREERILKEAEYMIEHNATVRETAQIFGISKSTVYQDVAEKLFEIDPGMAMKVDRVLAKNKAERYLRGGFATKKKYKDLRLKMSEKHRN